MARVGFLGLGNMGLPMARNLAKAGHEVVGFDVAPAARKAAGEAGLKVAQSADGVLDGAETVVTMLPAGEHVRAVYLGGASAEGQGLLARATGNILFIDCSTIDVATSRDVHAAAVEQGQLMLDAPVSGGVAGADAGTLTFMVGGPDEAFAKGKPLFEVMGRTIVHAGGAGNGQAAKICNNMILGISMIAVAEAFTLGERLGLDPQVLFQISSKASGSCWAMLNHNPVPGIVETAAANRDYKPGFAAAMMHKDLKLAQAAADHAGAATPLGAEAAALYTLFVNAGHGGLDYSAIIKLIQGRQGD